MGRKERDAKRQAAMLQQQAKNRRNDNLNE